VDARAAVGLVEALAAVAGRVLVHIELSVEAEGLRIRAEKALDVRLRGQDVERLVLEGAQVLRADLRGELDLRQVEPLLRPRVTQAVPELEHEPGIVASRRPVLSTRTGLSPQRHEIPALARKVPPAEVRWEN
jgi:hypothetical protein